MKNIVNYMNLNFEFVIGCFKAACWWILLAAFAFFPPNSFLVEMIQSVCVLIAQTETTTEIRYENTGVFC